MRKNNQACYQWDGLFRKKNNLLMSMKGGSEWQKK